MANRIRNDTLQPRSIIIWYYRFSNQMRVIRFCPTFAPFLNPDIENT